MSLNENPADFPIIEFYATPQTLYNLEETVTLFWKCSAQGSDYVYSVHSDSWQPDSCLEGGTCYTCTDGSIGIGTSALDATTTFALDVINRRTAINTITAGGDQVGAIAVTPDGKLLLAAGINNHNLAFLDPATGKAEPELIQLGAIPYSIAITPDGSLALVATDNGLTLIDIASRAAIPGTLPVGEMPRSVAITPNGLMAVVGNKSSGNVTIV